MKSLIGGIVARAVRSEVAMPVPLSGRGWLSPGARNVNDMEAQMSALGAVGTLFAIVHRISTAVGQVDWHLYRKAKSGDPDDRVEVTSHAALDVWNTPNPFYDQNTFIEAHQQFMDLTGECPWVMTLSGGMEGFPLQIWPVRPDKMEPVPNPKSYISGYIYSGPNGEKVPLSTRQVIHHKLPNPLDPYRGLGPVQALLTDIDAVTYSAQWNRNFFRNSAAPGGIIEIDKRLTDDEFLELTQRWEEQHRGVTNAHRVAILEQAKWVPNNYTMRDMQFAELRTVGRDTMMEAFGLGRPMLGITEDVNRANADAAEYVFSKYITTTRLERLKMKLNHVFLPLFGPGAANLEFDFDSPVTEDQEIANNTLATQAQAALNLVNAGYEPAGVLEAVGLPEIEYAGKPEPPAPIHVLPPEPNEPSVEPDEEPDSGEDAPENRHRLVVFARGAVPNPREQDTEAPDDVDLSHVEDALNSAIAALIARWSSVQRAQIHGLMEQVRAIVESGDLTRLTTLKADTEQAARFIEAAQSAIAGIGAAQAAQELNNEPDRGSRTAVPGDVDADQFSTDAAVAAEILGAGLALSAMRSTASNYSPELDTDDVVAAVEDDLSALTTTQAEDAIGGVLTQAMNFGRLATLKSTPEAAIYATEVMDKNTCKPCAAIDGTWLGNTDGQDFDMINQTYPNNQYVGCLGGARCRGTVTGVWRPEQTSGSE